MTEKEPVRWITVKGKHLPVYADGSIGVGQEDEPAEKYQDKFDMEQFGELQDGEDTQDFIQNNLKNKAFVQFGRDYDYEAIEQLQHTARYRKALKQGMHEMKIEDAISQVRDTIKASHISGWFREGNSEYKPRIAEQLLSNPETLNAAYNIAYHNYKYSTDKPLPFKKWLITPQTMYRGTSGQTDVQSDVFSAWTPDKKIAENFAFGGDGATGSQHGGEGKVSSIKIRPIDTWGSLQTTGEQEFMIPRRMDSYKPNQRRKNNGR